MSLMELNWFEQLLNDGLQTKSTPKTPTYPLSCEIMVWFWIGERNYTLAIREIFKCVDYPNAPEHIQIAATQLMAIIFLELEQPNVDIIALRLIKPEIIKLNYYVDHICKNLTEFCFDVVDIAWKFHKAIVDFPVKGIFINSFFTFTIREFVKLVDKTAPQVSNIIELIDMFDFYETVEDIALLNVFEARNICEYISISRSKAINDWPENVMQFIKEIEHRANPIPKVFKLNIKEPPQVFKVPKFDSDGFRTRGTAS